MKYLKYFENTIEEQPKIGDYILITVNQSRNPNIYEFINNNIGKVTHIIPDIKYGGVKTVVEYDKEPPEYTLEYFNHDSDNNTYNCWFKLIHPSKTTLQQHITSYIFAPTKLELETKLNAYKYNL